MTKKVKNILIALVVIAVVSSLAYYNSEQFGNEHILSVGKIVKCDGGGKGNFGPGIYYEYYADGRWHNASTRKNKLPYSIGSHIVGKSFPVVYRKFWYGYANDVLIIPADFTSFWYSFPDSLKWVLQYMTK